jgi:hypothetical protein
MTLITAGTYRALTAKYGSDAVDEVVTVSPETCVTSSHETSIILQSDT